MNGVESIFPRRARFETLALVEEISHRVVNEYSQAIADIRLAAADIASAEARDVLASAAARLRQFAEAHRALQAPRVVGGVDLGEYLERLCAAVTAASLKDRGVRLRLVTDSVCLPAERCWRVALIVSELITNAARHGLKGGPGSILVELEIAGTEIVCRVSDNGWAEFSPSPARGLAIVKGLAADLGGEVELCFGLTGTSAELTFPLSTAVAQDH